jgi:hypothetical protein
MSPEARRTTTRVFTPALFGCRMNSCTRQPPQFADQPSLHADSSTPERFRAAPDSMARTAASAGPFPSRRGP